MSMSDIQALGLRTYSGGGLGTTDASSQTLGQEDFLTLLVTQLKNQDPLSPMDNEAFVAQLAQFSTVSGINEMGSTLNRLENLASNARKDAPDWIGRTVSTSDGETGIVAGVHFDAENKSMLILDNGAQVPLSSVTFVA